MPKLQAKGKDEYIIMSKVPTEMAAAESSIVFSAFRSAVDGLLAQVNTPNKSHEMEKFSLQQYMMLKKLHDEMEENLKRGKLVLSVIKERLGAWQ